MCDVTVAIACYNVEKYIGECLSSVLEQSFESLEVLVCDDCSSDGSLNIVEQIARQHPRGKCVRILRAQANKGTASVRNVGIDHAKGKYLFFLDGDDCVTKNAIEVLYRRAEESQADLTFGNWKVFSGRKNIQLDNAGKYGSTNYRAALFKGQYAIPQWMESRHSDYFPVGLVNKLFRKSFIIDNHIRCVPEHTIIEDIYFGFQVVCKARTVAVIDEVTMFWRQREGSALHIDVREDRMNIYLNVFDTILDDIQKIKNEGGEEVPIQLYHTLTNRYVAGFVTWNILKSRLLTEKQKKDYLDHVAILTRLGIKRKQLTGILGQVCFPILRLKHKIHLFRLCFWLYDRYLWFHDQLHKIGGKKD